MAGVTGKGSIVRAGVECVAAAVGAAPMMEADGEAGAEWSRDDRRVYLNQILLIIQEKLLDTCHEQQLHQSGLLMRPSDYDVVVEERALMHLCGLPTCPNTISIPSKAPRYHVVLSKRIVIENEPTLPLFCSPSCSEKSCRFRAGLGEEAIHHRGHLISKIDMNLPAPPGSQFEGVMKERVIEKPFVHPEQPPPAAVIIVAADDVAPVVKTAEGIPSPALQLDEPIQSHGLSFTDMLFDLASVARQDLPADAKQLELVAPGANENDDDDGEDDEGRAQFPLSDFSQVLLHLTRWADAPCPSNPQAEIKRKEQIRSQIAPVMSLFPPTLHTLISPRLPSLIDALALDRPIRPSPTSTQWTLIGVALIHALSLHLAPERDATQCIRSDCRHSDETCIEGFLMSVHVNSERINLLSELLAEQTSTIN